MAKSLQLKSSLGKWKNLSTLLRRIYDTSHVLISTGFIKRNDNGNLIISKNSKDEYQKLKLEKVSKLEANKVKLSNHFKMVLIT